MNHTNTLQSGDTKNFWMSVNPYFILSYLLVLAGAFIKFPSLSYLPEVWAEVGTNYFYHAYHSPLSTNIVTSDYGYFPLFPRLLSLLFVKVFGLTEAFPMVAQISGLLFIALFSAFLNLNCFRSLIDNDLTRFVLSVTIGLIPDYELYSFINFPYFGFLFCVLVLFIEKEKISLGFYSFIALISFILLCSKAVFIIFAPLYGLAFLYFIYKKNRSEIYFYSILLAGILIQLAFIYFHKDESYRPDSTVNLPLHVTIDKTLYSFWAVLVSVFAGDGYPGEIAVRGLNFIFFLAFLCLSAFVLRKIYKDHKIAPALFFLCCLYLILSSALLNVVAFKTLYYGQNHTLNWFYFQKVPLFRWTYFPLVAALVGFSVLLANLIPYRILSLVFIVYLSIKFSLTKFNEAQDTWKYANSNWESYKHLLKDPEYYIPVNPFYPWAIQRKTSIMATTNNQIPKLEGKELYGVLVLKDSLNRIPVTHLFAYDSKEAKWVEAKRLDSGRGSSLFFHFPQKIKADTLRYQDDQGATLSLPLGATKFIVKDPTKK